MSYSPLRRKYVGFTIVQELDTRYEGYCAVQVMDI